MKFQATREELLRAINTVQKAVPSKTSMPILYSILLEADAGKIQMTGTDMNFGIKTDAIAFVEEPGQICIDARMFSEIIKKFPNGDVRISVDEDGKATIKCGKSTFHIAGKSADDYAELPTVNGENEVTISQSQLRKLIQQTTFSLAMNDSNPMMTGAYLQAYKDMLRMVCLDGHRMAIRCVDIDGASNDFEAIIPGKTLNEVSRILTDDPNKDVYICFTHNHVLFQFDSTTVVSRLISGKYFAVDKMLTDDFGTRITANKADLTASIDRATLFTNESEKRPVVLTISNDNVNLGIRSQLGSLSDDIPIEKDGNDLKIGVNPRFMLDALKAIDADDVSMYFISQSSPVFIRDEERSYIYMVLPVSI